MEVVVKTRLIGCSTKIMRQKCSLNFHPKLVFGEAPFSCSHIKISSNQLSRIAKHRVPCALDSVSPTEGKPESVSPTQDLENPENLVCHLEGFKVSVISRKHKRLKVHVEALGEVTQLVFDETLSMLAKKAPPIPGFRLVKGGKTPNIPKEVLLSVIGKAKVESDALHKLMDVAICLYLEKEKLRVRSRDLDLDEEIEYLQSIFKPGKDFAFDVTLPLA